MMTNAEKLYEIGKKVITSDTVYNQLSSQGGNRKLNALLEPLLKEMGAVYAHVSYGKGENVFLEVYFRFNLYAMCSVTVRDGGYGMPQLEVIMSNPTEDIGRLGVAYQVLYDWLKAPVTE